MALGNFDHIAIGTKLVREFDGTRFAVSDFSSRVVQGKVTTVLLLVELNEKGYAAGKRRVGLSDIPVNRATWSRA